VADPSDQLSGAAVGHGHDQNQANTLGVKPPRDAHAKKDVVLANPAKSSGPGLPNFAPYAQRPPLSLPITAARAFSNGQNAVQ